MCRRWIPPFCPQSSGFAAPRPVSGSQAQRGFTLLEVVVALAIVGLGVMTLLEIFSLGLRLQAHGSERTAAMVYGRQVMDGLLIRREILGGRDNGAARDKGRWNVQVGPFRDDNELSSSIPWELQEITLELRLPDAQAQQPIEMKTLRLVRKNVRP